MKNLILLLLLAVGSLVEAQDGGNATMSLLGEPNRVVELPIPSETINPMNNQTRHGEHAPPMTLKKLVVDNGVQVLANTSNAAHFSYSDPSPAAGGPAAGGPTTATVRSTFLVIARDSASAYSATSGLNDYGIPYETLLVPSTGIALPALNSSTTKGNYGGIVVLSEVSYGNAQGDYASALTEAQWSAMFAYQSNFGVRMVRLDVVPSASTGTQSLGDCCAAEQEQLVQINDTSAFPTAGLVKGGVMSSVGLYHYPGAIVNSTLATAFATFSPNANFSKQSVAAVINNFGARQQMVFYLSFATDWSETSNILQHAWLTWATRGLYVGYRRAMLNTQVDDMFLTSPMYYPPGAAFRISTKDLEQHITWMKSMNSRLPPGSNYTVEVGHNGNGNIGVCPSACSSLSTATSSSSTSIIVIPSSGSTFPIVTTTSTVTIPLPSSDPAPSSSTESRSTRTRTRTRTRPVSETTITSTVTIDALQVRASATSASTYKTPIPRECGIGPITYPNQPDPTSLEYVKPTGSGTNLWPKVSTYPYSPTCISLDPLEVWWSNPANLNAFSHVSHTFTHENLDAATYYDTNNEIEWNQAWLKQVGISNATRFSPHGLIPPAITGLHNGDALRAWYENGIVNVVGDNTRSVLMNAQNEHWPLITTNASDYNFAGIQITPRWATNIYYNCDTTECDVNEWIAISSGKGNMTDLLALEKQTNSRHLLALHHDAFMFHQANLRWEGVGTTIVNGVAQQLSLLQMWVETVVAQYLSLVSWPLISLKHDDLAEAFRQRMARDQCGYTMSWTVDLTSQKITDVTVTSAGSSSPVANTCSVPVPLTVPGAVADDKGFRTEQLGNDPLTIWVPLTGSAVTMSLAKAVPL